MKGNYLLFLELKEDRRIKVGNLGEINFKKGIYVYIGSAMGGFLKRIQRYFKERRKHWHIDYFLEFSKILFVFLIPSDKNLEEEISGIMLDFGEPVQGFGCSDKESVSHLFRISLEDIPRIIAKLIQSIHFL